MTANKRLTDLHSAGQALLSHFRETVCSRLFARYPGAPKEILVSAAEGAVRVARRYDDCRHLTDDVLDQAIRTTIRHVVLGYDSTLSVLGGRVDDDLHKHLQASFWRIADLVAEEFAKPRLATTGGRKPKCRRVWPPRVGGWRQ